MVTSKFAKIHHLLASVIALTLWLPASPAHAGTDTDQLKTASHSMLSDFAVPIFRCVDNHYETVDPRSPYFNSCIDWHSSVHAHYALYVINEHTGSVNARDRADLTFNRYPVSSELSYMRARVVHNIYDNPYGFSWLLRLAKQREETTGDTTLRPLADFAFAQIKTQLRNPQVTVHETEYQNLSWAVMNYYEWAKYTKNNAEIAYVQNVVRDRIKPVACDPRWDAGTSNTGYFGKCLMRLAAVATVEGSTSTSWITDQLPSTYSVPPRQNLGSYHLNGLNFTHAFALARIGNVTGRANLVDNAARLVTYQHQQSSVWNGSYLNSHWLPQIGVLAIDEILAGSNDATTTT